MSQENELLGLLFGRGYLISFDLSEPRVGLSLFQISVERQSSPMLLDGNCEIL